MDRLEALALKTGAFKLIEKHALNDDRSIFDWRVDLKTDLGNVVSLYVTAKARVTPQEMWGVVQRLNEVRPAVAEMVLFTPVISERVAMACRENKISYFDGDGNCHIQVPGIFIHVEAGRKPKREVRLGIDLFAQKTSRVIRVLLESVGKGWSPGLLAREARVSPALVTHVRRTLLEEAYAQSRERFLYVQRPKELLDAWVQSYELPERRFYHSLLSSREILEKLPEMAEKHDGEYALTGLTGAWQAAPMVKQNVVSCYWASEFQGPLMWTLNALKATKVDSGANLIVWDCDDEFVFYGARKIDGARVVSAVQLYLDLMKIGGRGEEAAQEIVEKELIPKWQI